MSSPVDPSSPAAVPLAPPVDPARRQYRELADRAVNLDVGAIFSEAWALFTRNMGLLVGGVLLLRVLSGLVSTPLNVAATLLFDADNRVLAALGLQHNFLVQYGAGMTGTVIDRLLLNGVLTGGGLVIVALHLAGGRRAELADFFRGFGLFLPLFLVNFMQTTLFGLGLALLVLPGLAVSILSVWAMFLVVDREEDPWTALRGSVMVASRNLGPTALLWLVSVGLWLGSQATCGLGTLVAAPVTTLAWAIAYRRVFGIQPR